MSLNTNEQFLLGALVVSPSHNKIIVDNHEVNLQPQVMAVLCYLADNHHRVVSAEELIDKLWAGRVVSSQSVQRTISAIRKALKELLGDKPYVASYSKRGYQLLLTPGGLSLASAPNSEPVDPETSQVDEPVISSIRESSDSESSVSENKDSKKRMMSVVGLSLLLVVVIVAVIAAAGLSYKFNYSKLDLIAPGKVAPKTEFTSMRPYASYPVDEFYLEPHPDNIHTAYFSRLNSQKKSPYTLIIQNDNSERWVVTSGEHEWDNLNWSPDGKRLTAVSRDMSDGTFHDVIHLFTLDLDTRQLISDEILMDWRGRRVIGITWRDNDTLELTDFWDETKKRHRYRYPLSTRILNEIDQTKGGHAPHLVRVLGDKTALANFDNGNITVEIYQDDKSSGIPSAQTLLTRWQTDYHWVDISWIPDGSGVLVNGGAVRLSNLYLDGQRKPLSFNIMDTVHRPRYSPDGQRLYLTKELTNDDIWLAKLGGEREQMTDSKHMEWCARFSHSGDKIVYVSKASGTTQLWLKQGGQHTKLSNFAVDNAVECFSWSADDESIVYHYQGKIYRYSLKDRSEIVLLDDAEGLFPSAYYSETNELFYGKFIGHYDLGTFWRQDLDTQVAQALPLEAAAFSATYNRDTYFQKIGEAGLWLLKDGEQNAVQIDNLIPADRHMLAKDDNGVYYGGACSGQDLGIYYLDLRTGKRREIIALEKERDEIRCVYSFDPRQGVLFGVSPDFDTDVVILE
ncbi:MAG: hypothetical protein COA42_14745 [Alteromonadaceae bacterium]|nr:MAG: hypothetical protein COA42_14745 [Alteromonadaceae bacterium]